MGATAAAGDRLSADAAHPSSLARYPLSRQAPKVEAECPNRARSVLSGGRTVMRVPTGIDRRELSGMAGGWLALRAPTRAKTRRYRTLEQLNCALESAAWPPVG